MPNLIFLGTNGWYDSQTGNTVSMLIKCPEYYIVLDAGNGFWKLDQYIGNDRPVYLFISHFHLDHVIGLHTLSKNQFSNGLTIMVHEGGTEILTRLINFPYSKPLKDLLFTVKIIEIPAALGKLPFKATVLPMVHASFTLGIRLEIENKIITYCPDTGFCENAITLAQNADLLIAECAYKSRQINENWPHLNPEQAAEIAKRAGAKKLILTHFDAQNYPDFEYRKRAEQIARDVFKASFSSRDGMEVEV
jgi:ribonuclease BN (tRNA processing enzyme)